MCEDGVNEQASEERIPSQTLVDAGQDGWDAFPVQLVVQNTFIALVGVQSPTLHRSQSCTAAVCFGHDQSRDPKPGLMHCGEQGGNEDAKCSVEIQDHDHYKKCSDACAGTGRRSEEAVAQEDIGRTLMLRNLPRSVSQVSVLRCLQQYGFTDSVVLLYVPWSMGQKHGSNLGYGFVHMQTEEDAQALTAAWHGKFPFKRHPGRNPLTIADAAVQGAKENITFWNGGKVGQIRNPKFRPIVLKDIGLPGTQWQAKLGDCDLQR